MIFTKFTRFRAPSWFFVKTGHKETSHVNFVVIFEISTKFRLKNNAPSIKNEKKVVIGPPLLLATRTVEQSTRIAR